MVTFNHFSTPRWFADRGGWNATDAADRFGRYCEAAAAHVGDLIDWACTLNEPNVGAAVRHIGIAPAADGPASDLPPKPSAEELDRIAALRARSAQTPPRTLPAFQGAPVGAMAAAHRRGVEAIRSGPGRAKIGWTLALVDIQSVHGGETRQQEAFEQAQGVWLDVSADDDFVGVQTYTRERLGPDGLVARPAGAELMLTGWEVYGPALEHTVRAAAARSKVPVLVTEHGSATDDDEVRIRYTTEGLEGLKRCIDDGIDVAGYLHWSLLDNFEWTSGVRPHLRAHRRRPDQLRAHTEAVARMARRRRAPQRPALRTPWFSQRWIRRR